MDVTIVDTTGKESLRRKAATVNQRAASIAGAAKHVTYDEIVVGVHGHEFIPMVYETSGSYLPATDDLINRVAEAGMVNNRVGRLSSKCIRERIALCILHGNALIMRQGMSYMLRSIVAGVNNQDPPLITSCLSRGECCSDSIT